MDIEFIFKPILIIIAGSLLINIILKNLKLNNKEQINLRNLFIGSLIVIVIFGSINFYIAKIEYRKKFKKDLSFIDFINQGGIDNNFFKRMMVGFGTGIVFGAIDNF